MARRQQPKTFIAKVYGWHKSEGDPLLGLPGVSASGWIIWDNEAVCEVERRVEPSRNANREQWAARIRAIKGPLESDKVPAGSAVEIWTEKVASDTLTKVLTGKDHDAEGHPFKDLDLWKEVRKVRLGKRLEVTSLTYTKREYGGDHAMLDLIDEVKRVVEEKRDTLSEEEREAAAAAAKPPGKKRPNPYKPPPFDPVSED